MVDCESNGFPPSTEHSSAITDIYRYKFCAENEDNDSCTPTILVIPSILEELLVDIFDYLTFHDLYYYLKL